ncbi:MAG: thioredoxin domain-containing protein [Deltaproteobacteria bacterium]|nr:thioredoxin domain-containing protein [Deltaproteobacteria bacterium]
MQGNSSGGALVAAALILGASIVGGAYLLAGAMDRGSAELAGLNKSLKTVAAAPAPAARPSAPGRPDPGKVYEIELGDSPVRGSDSAKITIVEWADFQCPFCVRVTPTLEKIDEEYGDKVRFAFKHLPLSMHTKARAAHQAAEAAHRQGKFWEMHDRIFAKPKDLSEETYLRYANEIGLDIEKYKSDFSSSSVRKVIDADLAKARELGVSGTPSFFINGRFLSGAQPYNAFARVIDEELAKN